MKSTHDQLSCFNVSFKCYEIFKDTWKIVKIRRRKDGTLKALRTLLKALGILLIVFRSKCYKPL